MKRICFSILLFLAIVSCQADDIYQKINVYVEEIDKKADSLMKIEKDVFGLSAEGGNLTGYFEGDNLVKIKAELYGENGKAYLNIYFKVKKLIYVFEERYKYNASIYMDAERAEEVGLQVFDIKKSEINKMKYYFKEDKLLKWISDEIEIIPFSTVFVKTESRLLELKQIFIKKLYE